MDLPKGNKMGLIAQELKEVFPELLGSQVHPEGEYEENGKKIKYESVDYLGINYLELTPILIKSIQEQQQIIDNQQETIDNQQQIINDLIKKVEMLEKK